MKDATIRDLERRIERLATERTAMFAQGGSTAAIAEARTRLKAIERELDECYVAVRQHRAARDAQRFVAEDRALRARLARDPFRGR